MFKQDMSCLLQKLKNQHLRVRYCRNFSSRGSSFLKSHGEKGVGRYGVFVQFYPSENTFCRGKIIPLQTGLELLPSCSAGIKCLEAQMKFKGSEPLDSLLERTLWVVLIFGQAMVKQSLKAEYILKV